MTARDRIKAERCEFCKDKIPLPVCPHATAPSDFAIIEELARENERLRAQQSSGNWRVGAKIPLNVYDGDRPVCQCHTAEDSAKIVAAINGNDGLRAQQESLRKAMEKITILSTGWTHGREGVHLLRINETVIDSLDDLASLLQERGV